MDFKLVSKNNIGVISILILVILLSQSRFFDFLTETPLGRIVMLAFVILIAYVNKILGLIAVLFIIIAFNLNDINTVYSYNYFEGFDTSSNLVNELQNEDKKETAKENTNKNDLSSKDQNINESSQIATTTSSSISSQESFRGREGFCMSDRETNILRGKQSNSIPVLNLAREQNDDVNPSDKSVFTNDYASF